ncbi:toprim domain-containing protein [Micromonospora sp. WMMA1976]|uniref:toprim domain-containing protein n=1 Tax=Micromonospora sp. WMMA1976 TaxID=3014995 RepID=UPI00248D12C2|nr:toprim domain-containing protein [Micromonospora sp. WMMA1976]WBC05279.1 toprim domain-containing protein [Micromonospora sp. WMMA1976]
MGAPRLTPPSSSTRGDGLDAGRLVTAVEAAVTYYRDQLAHADGPRAYLVGRGLGVLVEREWPWRVGYAPPGWRSLTRHLRALGFGDDELVGAGLSNRTGAGRLIDVFRDRIVFPVRDPAGHAVAFLGRAGPGTGDGVPKYINSPTTAIYDKGRLLFGMAEQQERLDARWTPVLVEGPADVLAVWLSYSRSRGPGAVALAPCGTMLTGHQAAMLRELPGAADGIVAAFDADSAGRAAVDRAWQLLREPQAPGPLLVAEFAADADPADLLRRSNGRAQLRAALQRRARPMLDVVVDHRLARLVERHPRLLEDIDGRCAAVRALVPLLYEAASSDEAVRVGRRIVELTAVGVDTVAIAALTRLVCALNRT